MFVVILIAVGRAQIIGERGDINGVGDRKTIFDLIANRNSQFWFNQIIGHEVEKFQTSALLRVEFDHHVATVD